MYYCYEYLIKTITYSICSLNVLNLRTGLEQNENTAGMCHPTPVRMRTRTLPERGNLGC